MTTPRNCPGTVPGICRDAPPRGNGGCPAAGVYPEGIPTAGHPDPSGSVPAGRGTHG